MKIAVKLVYVKYLIPTELEASAKRIEDLVNDGWTLQATVPVGETGVFMFRRPELTYAEKAEMAKQGEEEKKTIDIDPEKK